MRYMTLRFFQRNFVGGEIQGPAFPQKGHGTDNNGFNGLFNSKVSDPELVTPSTKNICFV